VTFELFVRPAVNAMQGVPDPLPAFRKGTLAAPVRRNPHRDELVRARVRSEGDEAFLEALPGQESHMIVRSGRAEALVFVQAGTGEVAAGEEARFLPLI
jgi:molybdopterin biosynthesis enzyme